MPIWKILHTTEIKATKLQNLSHLLNSITCPALGIFN